MARHFFNWESAFRENRRVAGGPRYSHDRKSAGSHRSERHDRHTADIESNDLPGLAAARVVQLVQSPKLGEAERAVERPIVEVARRVVGVIGVRVSVRRAAREAHEVTADRLAFSPEIVRQNINRLQRRPVFHESAEGRDVPVIAARNRIEVEGGARRQGENGSPRVLITAVWAVALELG